MPQKGKYKVRIDGSYQQIHLETELEQVVGAQEALDTKSDVGHKHDATDIETGTLDAERIPNLSANKITTDTLGVDRIPNLPASKTTSGSFHADRIPNLPASKTTSGTFNADRIPLLDASKITTGTLGVARIPNLDASKIVSGELDLARIPELPASRITSGIIDIDRLPAAALERLIVVANQAARFALTTTEVQKGDTVQQEDTGIMYRVIDDTKLNVEAGYKSYTAGAAASVPWDGVTGKPESYPATAHTHTPAQVGLGNVANLSRASQAEAEAGTTNDRYMTPLRTMQAMQDKAPGIVNVAGNYAKGVIDARSSDNTDVWTGTQEQYDALETIDPNTVYFIIDATGPQNVLDAHVNNTDNPHQVTKTQVGLGSVENYGIATTEEAQAGTSGTKYMTPQRVAQAIAELAPPEDLSTYDAHIADDDNPHSVTKSQIGLGNVTNDKQATETAFVAHRDAVNNPHSVTKSQIGLGNVSNVLQASKTEFDAHASNTSNPHSVTKAQVNLGNVTNDAQVKRTEMGTANGVATLDANTKIPLSQIPDSARQQTYVVLNLVDLPTPTITGEKGFVTSTGKSYIWDGTEWQVLADTDWENVNLSWANIDDKPATFPPSSHGHALDDALITGILPVGKGGTGRNSLTSNLVLVGNGTNAVSLVNRSGIDTRQEFPPSEHTHTIANVTNLQTELNKKATVHVSTAEPGSAINGDVWIHTS